MTYSDHSRQSMLSVPTRWSELYFGIFGFLCAGGEVFVICYGIFRRAPNADAPDIAADMLLHLAAVPIVAALQAYLIMRARDLIMKTWETFRMERYNKGREEGRNEGREEGREEERARVIREIRERLARREASERGEREDWLDEILSELSENGGGERRRPRN